MRKVLNMVRTPWYLYLEGGHVSHPQFVTARPPGCFAHTCGVRTNTVRMVNKLLLGSEEENNPRSIGGFWPRVYQILPQETFERTPLVTPHCDCSIHCTGEVQCPLVSALRGSRLCQGSSLRCLMQSMDTSPLSDGLIPTTSGRECLGFESSCLL